MPNTIVSAGATGLPKSRGVLRIEHTPTLPEMIEREQIRSRIEAAIARLIDALDDIDASAEDLEDGDDAESLNEDGDELDAGEMDEFGIVRWTVHA